MTMLTDTQLVILTSAARREDCAILPFPRKLNLAGDATATVFEDLLKKKLIAEQPGPSEAAAWRDGENGERIMLVATTAGLRAIGGAPAEQHTQGGREGAAGLQEKGAHVWDVPPDATFPTQRP
jgi:hypothetical protein